MVFAIHQHEPVTGIHVCPLILKPPPQLPPSALSQSTGFGCPPSCIEIALVSIYKWYIPNPLLPTLKLPTIESGKPNAFLVRFSYSYT